MDNETAFWQDYQKWFEYKKKQPLSSLQRKVIVYFEEANSIFEKVDDTWGRSIKRPELPSPKDALRIVEESLREFSKLKPPSIAKKHYAALLKLLAIIKSYHLKRNVDPDSTELEQLGRDAIPHEGIQSSEYFRILKEVGLFDSIEKEMDIISGRTIGDKTSSEIQKEFE